MFGVSDAEAAKWAGMDDDEEDCLIEPDNWQTVMVFLAMATQWRIVVGIGGASYQGLRYEGLNFVFRMRRVAADEQPAMFDGLRVMESAALKVMNSAKPVA